jgi:hypothetical protein
MVAPAGLVRSSRILSAMLVFDSRTSSPFAHSVRRSGLFGSTA